MLAEYRTIGGVRYTVYPQHHKKEAAERIAKQHRSWGHKVRLLKEGDTYRIAIRYNE